MRFLAIPIASLLIAGLCQVSSADDTKNAAISKDFKSMAGTWTVIAREADGQRAPAEAIKGVVVKVAEDGTASITKDGKVVSKVKWVNVDPTLKSKATDVEVVEGDDKGKTLLAIYRIEGDQVTVCTATSGKDRPTEFSAKADSGRTMTTYTRSKPE